MLGYILRRVLYAVPILVGVNLITFALFFVLNTPDDMARMQLGTKRVTAEAIEKWKAERGYDKPMLWNGNASGLAKLEDTIFFQKSVRLFVLDFGAAEDGRDIGSEIRARVGPSLAIAVPVFLVGLVVNVSFALLMAFFRATYVDFSGVVLHRQANIAVFFREEKHLDQKSRDDIDAKRKHFDRILSKLLHEGVASGEFHIADVNLAALAIGGMISWAYTWHRPGGRLGVEDLCTRMADLAAQLAGVREPAVV